MCNCMTGYTSSGDLKTCHDIDECSSSSTSDCDAAERADCVNNNGSYTCACKTGYNGDGRTCREERLVPFLNDTKITGAYSDYICLEFAVPIGDYYQPCMYVTKSGLILFSEVHSGNKNSGIRRTYSNPAADFPFLQQSNLQEKEAVAVYWANMQTGIGNVTNQGVYYRVYSSSVTSENAVIVSVAGDVQTALSNSFAAKAMVVFTWYKMQYPVTGEEVTFQAILMTDFINTNVLLKYQEMHWNILTGSMTFYPATIGLSRNMASYMYPFSFLSISTDANKDKLVFIQTPDLVDPTSSALGNLNDNFFYKIGSKKGQFVLKLSDNSGSTLQKSLKCHNWLQTDLADMTHPLNDTSDASTCPSSVSMFPPSTYSLLVNSRIPSGVDCYVNIAASDASSSSPQSKRCCYQSNGIITNIQSANCVNTYQRHLASAQALDDAACDYCCASDIMSYTTREMCNEFVTRRPIGTSASYANGANAACRGDPHFSSLDGVPFTFNGRGDFIMLNSTTFRFLARLDAYVKDGIEQVATILRALIAKQVTPASDTVEFRLNDTTAALEISRNGVLTEVTSTSFWTEVTITMPTTLDSANNTVTTYYMAFSSGAVIGASVSNGLIQLSVNGPSTMKGTFEGVLGNFNDNQEDDFADPAGNVLSGGSSATEEQIYDTLIHCKFCWSTANVNWTLFTDANGNPEFITVNSSIRPMFFVSNLTVMFPNDTERSLAISTCYGLGPEDPDPTQRKECYFDFKVTGDSSLAQATSAAKAETESNRANLENFPPVASTENVTLHVTINTNYSSLYTLMATDANNDSISFAIDPLKTSSGVAIDNVTGVISWYNIPDTSLSITVIISDGKTSSVWTPTIYLCKCVGTGTTCDFANSGSGLFEIVPCICGPGLEGTFCETDIDGCAGQYCFHGVLCTDIAAAEVAAAGAEATCAACPFGLTGDGRTCTEVNECLVYTPCDHNCQDLVGGYSCSCNAGFDLQADLRSCVDSDECLKGTDLCNTANTQCRNTNGTYACDCLSGYAYKSFLECQDINECITGAFTCPNNSRCSNTVGGYTCDCNFGYERDEQLNTCIEINECLQKNTCEQKCVDGVGIYTCECLPGFVLDADARTCNANGTCTAGEIQACDGGSSQSKCSPDPVNGGTTCACPSGFALNSSNFCEDINECLSSSGVCDAVSSTCNNTEGGYVCDCKTGFSPVSDTCTDINECTGGTHTCNAPGYCINIAGSFGCKCPDGMFLLADGRTCQNIDECTLGTDNCDSEKGVCTDQTPGYSCTCASGYTGDGFTCVDYNECAQSNKGGCSQRCMNSIGAHSCSCFDGYTLANDGTTCEDINECQAAGGHDCFSVDYCTNNNGSFACSCPTNFTLKGDGRTSLYQCSDNHGCSYRCGMINSVETCLCEAGYQLDAATNKICEDINECSNSSLHSCELSNNVRCNNLNGSFECICVNSSYSQVERGRCEDVDECLAQTFTCGANSKCVNAEPEYACTCLVGYADIGGTCQDLDECQLGTDNCNGTTGDCTNIPGGFTCACKTGYSGNGIICSDINECLLGTDSCDPRSSRGSCTNTVGSYNCNCTSGYLLASNGYTCIDVDECTLNTDNCDFKCNNIDGGYYCTCDTGYRLALDQSSCIDVDECATLSPCDSNNGACNNTQGSYTCNCINQYTLGPGNTCTDRDGMWTEWGNWSTCSVDCGPGTQTKTRNCTNPTREGFGADCAAPGSETMSCDTPCYPNAVEQTNGVVVNFNGVTVAQLGAITSSFKQTIADTLGTFCNYNTSNVQLCCNTTKNYTPNPSSPLTFTTSSDIAFGAGYPRTSSSGSGVDVLLVVKYVMSSPLCSAAAAAPSRRKRAVGVTLTGLEEALTQELLQSIINNPVLQQNIATAIETQVNAVLGQTVNVTVDSVQLVTTTTTTTTTQTTPTSTGRGTKVWVIVVATIGAIVGVIIIVVVIVVLLKL
ncbi:Fibrillin-3 [Mizuhopecten yessoensis]|uniref:Fibrillin-3 n=1 Tax=Mizuhopecten yessoensis TaxID=6573 RepID=A0A210R4R5_MIZYE|nr:Fibrillin-3 [Mizuhopecten yessoensis]